MASHSVYSTYATARFSLIFLAISIRSAVGEFCQGFTDTRGIVHPGFQCPGEADQFEDYKCCGTSIDYYCCTYEDYKYSYGRFYWSVGKIVGVVLGAVFGAILFVVVIAVICCCYARNFQKKRAQQTANASQQMTHVTAATQQTTQQQVDTQLTARRKQLLYEHVQGYPDVGRQVHPEQNQGYPDLGHQTHPEQNQAYSLQGNLHTNTNPMHYPQSDTYAPQVQQAHPAAARAMPLGYPQHQEPLSPPPSYFSHQLPLTDGPHAPEVAPPPPPSFN